MKSNFFLQLIICCFALLMSHNAQAQIAEKDVTAFAQDKGTLLLETFALTDLPQKYAKLDELFLNYVDLDYIAKFVIGKHWRNMSEPQQTQYVGLFKRYALSVYKNFPLSFENKITFKVDRVTAEKDKASAMVVIAVPKPDGQIQHFAVEFALHQNNGALQIIDIKLEQASLILSYRSRFYEMVQQADGDIVWFLEDLAVITDSNEKNVELTLENN